MVCYAMGWLRLPVFDAADGGAGGGGDDGAAAAAAAAAALAAGGAGDGGAGGDGAGDGGAGGFKWEGLDDDLKGFVGDKTPAEIAKEGFAHKQSATRRAEQIMKESGMLAPPETGKELDFFKGFAPEEVAAYADAAKDELGEDAGAGGAALMAAAKDAGLHPQQFKSLIGGLKEANAKAAEEQGKAFDTALTAAWGDKRAGNSTLLERAAKVLAPDMDANAVIAAVTSLNPGGDPAVTVRQLDALVRIGQQFEEGVNDPGGQAGHLAIVDEHKALKAKAIDFGGVENLPLSDQKRLTQLQDEVSKNG